MSEVINVELKREFDHYRGWYESENFNIGVPGDGIDDIVSQVQEKNPGCKVVITNPEIVAKLSKEQIDHLIRQMIPIDKNKHCALERMRRKQWREEARKKLYKKHGYE